MWDLNFGTWISHRGFTVAFGHGHPLVKLKEKRKRNGKYVCEGGKKKVAFTKWEFS
jgi:hypothetical protein